MRRSLMYEIDLTKIEGDGAFPVQSVELLFLRMMKQKASTQFLKQSLKAILWKSW